MGERRKETTLRDIVGLIHGYISFFLFSSLLNNTFYACTTTTQANVHNYITYEYTYESMIKKM